MQEREKDEAKSKVFIIARTSMSSRILLTDTLPILHYSDNYSGTSGSLGSVKAKVLSDFSKGNSNVFKVIHFLGYWIEHKSSELATYVNTGVQTWM
jgi:hypothetical protein